MKQARDYRKYNVRLTSADWQRGSARVITSDVRVQLIVSQINALLLDLQGLEFQLTEKRRTKIRTSAARSMHSKLSVFHCDCYMQNLIIVSLTDLFP